MLPTIEDLIAQAVAEGRVNRIPAGVSGIVRKPKDETRTRFHPEHCGKGGRVDRHRFLEEIDGDWS